MMVGAGSRNIRIALRPIDPRKPGGVRGMIGDVSGALTVTHNPKSLGPSLLHRFSGSWQKLDNTWHSVPFTRHELQIVDVRIRIRRIGGRPGRWPCRDHWQPATTRSAQPDGATKAAPARPA